ncbi:MAG: response regulator [Spirochaetes bacterium]|nr:response regulator [Spirochaetota bacterium]
MKKILLVDDSTAIRNIIKTALFGDYELLEAENGQVALNKAQENKIDLFLLDVNMPVMDGITCVKELRKTIKYSNTPIIMLTTESRDDKKQQGKEAGANGWIVKPCEPEKLLNVIKKMI